MKRLLILFLVLTIWTCSKDSKSPSEPEQPPIVVNLTSLNGQAQKGPFNNGTAINVAELSNTLSPTGRNFSSSITDNTGRFAVANVQLESPYVELRANGYYFNEVKNEISSGQLTLYALSDLTGKNSLNVNIITHLEKNRIATLMTGESAKTFAQAKLQAQEEILAIFDYSRANMPASELLDISQGGAANAKLLAISAIVQGNLTVGQMSELLANISTDLASDGVLDDANLKNTLIDNTKNLDLNAIRTNLANRYQSLGISATIADFESEVNQFLKPPVVQDMSVSTEEDTPINITLAGSDPEGESLTYYILETNNATISLNGNVVNYTPNANYNGTDTFTYKANDGTSDSNTGTVTITVGAVDDDPNTQDIEVTTDEDVTIAFALTAEEYDGQSYSFALRSQPTNGSVSLSGNTATYTPNDNWNGQDSFTFEATDDRLIVGVRNVATATITVNAVNDAPIANDITNQVTNENRMMQLEITLDATDVDGDDLTYRVVSTNNGSVNINNNIATYVPTQDWNGEDTFSYVANDGSVDSNTATVKITVNSVNDAPVTSNSEMTIDEDSLDGEFTNITNYATDVDGDALIYIITKLPFGGNLCQNAGATCGTVLAVGDTVTGENGIETSNPFYMPNENWHGQDQFEWKVNDGVFDSNISKVTVNVNGINDLPVVTDITTSTSEDNPVTFSVHDYITDPDGDSTYWYYFVDTQPTNGTVAIEDSNNGNYTYTPNENWNGTDSFTWYVYDDGNGPEPGNSNVATVTITVNSVNDAPVAIDLTASTSEDNSVEIPLEYFDAEGDIHDNLMFYISSTPSNGRVSLNESQTIATYSPNNGFYGTDQFSYSTENVSPSSIEAWVTIEVSEVVGDLTIFPDLIEGYSERFSDIVYDVSNGGFIVAGYTHNKNDSSGPPWGEGGTWKMFKLSVDSFMDTQFYETLDFQRSPVWYNQKQNSVHGFDISRVSHDGNYILSMWNDYLWSVDSSGNSVFNQFSGSIESGYNWIDNISNIFQLNDGTFIILGAVRKADSSTSEKYPIIAVIDQNLTILNYKILDNHITDNSLKYDSYYNRMVYNHNDGVVYVIAQTNIIGFNNSNQLNYYEVGLSAMGSNYFTINRYENLSDISASPTQMFIQGENSDVLTYKRNPNGYDEFILMTEESFTNRLMLVYYRLMDNGSKEIVETFYPNHSGSHDFMELVDSGNRYYLVAQEGNDIRVQSIFDTENFGTQFDKLIDITGLGYEDKLGGATAINFYNNGSGIAITGSTRKDSTEDWDGFILLLDLYGD